MDYVKTKQLYEEIGQIKSLEETADFSRYKKELKWYEDVKSKQTGEYYQANELIRRDLVAKTWKPPHIDKNGEPLEYPLKYINGIHRYQLLICQSGILKCGTVWMFTAIP